MNRRFLIDAGERVLWTAVEAAAAALLAAGAFDAKAGKAALVAGLTAGVALVKVFAAKAVGNKDSAALLPVTADPTATADFAVSASVAAHPKKTAPKKKAK